MFYDIDTRASKANALHCYISQHVALQEGWYCNIIANQCRAKKKKMAMMIFSNVAFSTSGKSVFHQMLLSHELCSTKISELYK